MPPLDFRTVRRTAITALFSDDFLFDRIVLKGGNALSLVLEISERTSLDLDFSIENDFDDPGLVAARISASLVKRFRRAGYIVFDFKFEKKPNVAREGDSPRWGGYRAFFKLMQVDKYLGLKNDIDAIRRDALVIGPNQERVFSIDLSKCEYVRGKRTIDIDDFAVHVYTAEMIAIEKLRAICQQMPEYTPNRAPARRAQDFYDIHLIVTKTGADLLSAENLEMARQIFAAKEVPKVLLNRISQQREFHRPDWDNVRISVRDHLREFDYYFEFVVAAAESLEALWNE